MKLYTFVVHYLQMCMKEYGCCPKFKRGDNSTYAFTKEVKLYTSNNIRTTKMSRCNNYQQKSKVPLNCRLNAISNSL
jgi:hypothetical protein